LPARVLFAHDDGDAMKIPIASQETNAAAVTSGRVTEKSLRFRRRFFSRRRHRELSRSLTQKTFCMGARACCFLSTKRDEQHSLSWLGI